MVSDERKRSTTAAMSDPCTQQPVPKLQSPLRPARRLAPLTALVVTLSACTVTPKPLSVECTMAAIVAGGAGCASVSRASDASDVEAKRFSPVAGKANIYVVRPSIVGGRYLWDIEIDGKRAGPISEHSYLLLEVDPGQHELAAITGENRHALKVSANVGESVVVEVVSRMGWVESRAELRGVPLEQGQALVRSAKRVNAI